MTTEVKKAGTVIEAGLGTTKRVAEFVVKTGYRQIPQEAVKIAKDAILDCLGCMIAGAKEPPPELVTQYVKELGGKPEAGVITKGFKTSAPLAALVNGTMAHVLDYDDVAASWWGHPTVVLLPTVFALAEKGKLSGEAILEAYILGFEVGSRVNQGLGIGYYNAGWHATITAGTLATAVAAAKMMKLDTEKVRMALGIAASLTGGLKRNFGTMTKSLHAGMAAHDGIIAASLAKQGFSADDSIFEVPQGYCQIYSQNYNLEKITQGLGSPFDIISPGLTIKPYPCCRATHLSIDAMLYLIHKHDIKAGDVVEVKCRTAPSVPVMLYYHEPKASLEGKFSLEYCMAVALLDRDVKLAQFEDERVNRSDVQKLLRKVRYVHPEGVDWTGETRPAAGVTVRLKDGREFSHELRHAKGDPATPLSQEELAAKFRDCAQKVLSSRDTERCLDMITNLESLKNISPLMDILT